MNPYRYVKEATENGETLLSLCCGIGYELNGIKASHITAVDIASQYVEALKLNHPGVEAVCNDSLKYLKEQPDNTVDVISIIDGVEHMDKKTGLEVIEEMKRVAKREVLLFTPQGHVDGGYLKNEPHNAWGIEGADEHQKHKSGWTALELKDLGFEMLEMTDDISQHGEPYTALMAAWRK